ncbi:hypothetical protein [Streptomyces sp. NPDC048428]|uniref:RHS repeat domain-containing protein n=1 Tax=Streptomyces sp. NPDC048428 TaxID=3154503 RepID=UPI003413A095
MWTSTYDLLGRKTDQVDPDTGASHSEFDAAGRVTSATDARKRTLSYSYDELGRQTAKYDTTGGVEKSDANKLASWAYDSLKKGLTTSSTSYSGGSVYVSKVLGYDSHGWPQASALVIPADEGKLQGHIPHAEPVQPDGHPALVHGHRGGVPAAGDLHLRLRQVRPPEERRFRVART